MNSATNMTTEGKKVQGNCKDVNHFQNKNFAINKEILRILQEIVIKPPLIKPPPPTADMLIFAI